uniref:Uncharacterized protein n=1 Tax=Candidatus Kentrum sp. DK TaxID=2126562 RepID=A0A450TG05_9GAMM|nr:MAG: hypothetical protein BECKDK2373B_GA0170837_11613 [Candidatus Kentron sp. DK]
MNNEAEIPRHIVVTSTKNMGISLILTILFGPLGMLYSTIPGGIIMMILSLIVGILTAGAGLPITWLISIIWGAMAVSRWNKNLLAKASRQL